MDEITNISYQMYDLIPTKNYFYNFRNTYRLDTQDIESDKVVLNRIPPTTQEFPKKFHVVTDKWNNVGNDIFALNIVFRYLNIRKTQYYQAHFLY